MFVNAQLSVKRFFTAVVYGFFTETFQSGGKVLIKRTLKFYNFVSKFSQCNSNHIQLIMRNVFVFTVDKAIYKRE